MKGCKIMIEPIGSTNYNNYNNFWSNPAYSTNYYGNYQTQAVVSEPNFHGKDDNKTSDKKSNSKQKAIIYSLVGLGIIALGTLALYKGGTKGAKKVAEEAKKEVSQATKKEQKKAVSEVEELIQKKSQATTFDEKFSLTKSIFEKSDDKKCIQAGQDYLQYIDDIQSRKSFLEDKKLQEFFAKSDNIAYVKSGIYGKMSDVYKKENNLPNAIKMMKKSLEYDAENEFIIRDLAKLYAENKNPDEGLKIAKSALQKIQDNAFNDNQVCLFDAIAECAKAKGDEKLFKSINILKEGSYNKFKKLSPEDINFITENGIDYQKICGENGGREQSGAMAKWVLAQIEQIH